MRRAVVEDGLRRAARLEHHRVAIELFMDGADGELAVARTTVLLRHVDRPQAQLAGLGLELRAQRPRHVALEQELLLQRREALFSESLRCSDELLDVVGEIEVHAAAPSVGVAGWKSVRTAVSEPSA